MATSPVDNVFEFRGVEDLFYAEVAEDSENQFSTGTPKRLSYTATISKEVESSSETHYYDNKGMIVINAKGAETFTLTVAPPKLETLAEITGQAFDAASGMLMEGDVTPKYFAIGYKTKGTDGNWRYCWKYKGQFAIPSEEVNTESDSIDTTNTELTFTAINTIHKFTQNIGEETINKTMSGIVVDERYGGMTEAMKEAWTKKVWTPSDVHNKVVPTDV
nr:MAG TPA: tail tube protein [Caudoviricetes sp.]